MPEDPKKFPIPIRLKVPWETFISHATQSLSAECGKPLILTGKSFVTVEYQEGELPVQHLPMYVYLDIDLEDYFMGGA